MAEARASVRLGWLAILAGVALALATQVAAPVAVPLYDGVVVQEPYRYLHPTSGQVGDPTSFVAAPPVVGGVSPEIVAATTESPIQAQLIAQMGAFEVPPGATSLQVSIIPIEPPAVSPVGRIAGNVYRVSITDPAGTPVTAKPCLRCRTLVLRAPEGVIEGTIQRFADGAWVEVETLHVALGMYQANVTELGDFAIVTRGPGAGGEVDITLVLLGGGIVLVLLAFVALLVLRGRPAPAYPSAGSGGGGRPAIPSRIPSKRRGGRRPPSGRSST